MVLHLQNFPSFLSIDGVYVRVQHTFENVTKYGTCWVYAQVMSAKTGNALGIPKDMTKKISKGFARVLVFDSKPAPKTRRKVQVNVFNFVSLGKGQADDPICVARFSISDSTLDRIAERRRPNDKDLEPFAPFDLEFFSHLDCNGNPIYRAMFALGDPPHVHPVIQLSHLKSRCDVDMEYGPDLILCRTPPPAGFIPSSLREQGEHCDGNFYHAKGQWSQDAQGQYRVSHHVPLTTDRHTENIKMIEPLFLNGPAHLNSLSVLIGINANTTLTFPQSPAQGRRGNVVQPTPFGGLDTFSFVEGHMGSMYGLHPNERPHVYGHCRDLRQFPVCNVMSLLAILAAKQRVECLRAKQTKCMPTIILSPIHSHRHR
jgi:hypothetical protein